MRQIKVMRRRTLGSQVLSRHRGMSDVEFESAREREAWRRWEREMYDPPHWYAWQAPTVGDRLVALDARLPYWVVLAIRDFLALVLFYAVAAAVLANW